MPNPRALLSGLALCCLFAQTATAQTADDKQQQVPQTGPAQTAPLAGSGMSAAEFEAYATGKTLMYGVDGVPYGAETYLPGRRVVWAFSEDQCQRGTWYEAAGLICFVYETDPTPQCWTFQKTATGLRARFEGDPGGSGLVEVGQSDAPLSCPGPDVGV